LLEENYVILLAENCVILKTLTPLLFFFWLPSHYCNWAVWW
jgi:hypothetical protein